jgi:hypothetical protein
MMYTIKMASGGMIYVPSVMKIGAGVQKLLGGYTHSKVILDKSTFIFLNKESRLKFFHILQCIADWLASMR